MDNQKLTEELRRRIKNYCKMLDRLDDVENSRDGKRMVQIAYLSFKSGEDVTVSDFVEALKTNERLALKDDNDLQKYVEDKLLRFLKDSKFTIMMLDKCELLVNDDEYCIRKEI